jgi:hypothetical protein
VTTTEQTLLAATVLFFAVDFSCSVAGNCSCKEVDIAFIRRFHLNLSLQLIPLSLAIFAAVVDAKIRCHQLQFLEQLVPASVELLLFFCRSSLAFAPPFYNSAIPAMHPVPAEVNDC